MKKYLVVIIIILSGIAVISCGGSEAKQTSELTTANAQKLVFFDKANAFKTKINHLMISGSSFDELSMRLPRKSNAEDYHYTKDDFLDSYHQQKGMSVDINRSGFLLVYRDLLNDIIEALDNNDIVDFNAFINIDFGQYGDADIYCGYTQENVLIFKMNYILNNQRIFSAFKMGYFEDKFFIKQMDYYQDGDNISYGYEEFTENQNYFHLRFNNENEFAFHYISEENLYEIEVVKGENAIEAEGPVTGYNIRWNDVERNMRFLYSISDESIIISENIDFYNDYSIVLSYMDNDTRNADLRLIWNLLEADGFDYVTFNNNGDDYDMHADVMKDEVNLFPDEIVRAYINENNCLLSLDKIVSRSELTNEKLGLTDYGLDFAKGTYTLEYIDSIREDASDTVVNFEVFSGLNIYDPNFTSTFLDMIDSDLSFVSAVAI